METPLLFDSHAHYDDSKFNDDRDEIILSLKENGIGRVVNIGCSFESMEKASRLAEKYDFIYSSAGIHPNDAQYAEDNPDTLEIIKSYLAKDKTVAIGEIGLDYHWDEPSREIQKKWFEIQLKLAEETGYPVIIHDRDAHGDTLEIIRKHPGVTGVFHSFSGSPEMAKELVKRGYYISFSGVLTFKNAAKLPEVALETPMDRILIETDCPYLAPHPHRGERNSSLLMKYTAEKLAEIKGKTYEEVCLNTYENAMRVYRL
jgi:TatD DNase family protein